MAESESVTNSAPPPARSLSGTTIGHFEVRERLGKGGMGEVYRAQDTRLRRTVAVKRLAPQLCADHLYRRRFLEEAARASRFSDPRIAAIYEFVEEGNEMFLVMEFVEGETLRQRLRRPIELPEFFEIAIQCAEALAAAHERGIVHCDVKPENIMLTPEGRVKVLDFGVAKRLPRSDQSSTIDRAGTMAGTPAYMSPEVLMEKAPDARADIFSLGIVFYEVLTGHHPFMANGFIATSDRIRNETPAPTRIFNKKVPSPLEDLVGKMLAKEPGSRYKSAGDLAKDLRFIQMGKDPGITVPSAPRASKRPWSAVLAVVALIVALVSAAYFGWYRPSHRPHILAERGWVLISDFEGRGDDPVPDSAVREGLTIALQQSRYVNVFPRARVYESLQRMKKTDVSGIDEALGREICQRENLQVLLTGSIEHFGDVFQITVRALDPVRGTLLFADKERFNRKEEFFEKADAVAKRARQELGESMAGIEANSRPLAKVTTGSLEALQLYSQAADATAKGNTERVAALLQNALLLDPDFAMAHLRLGQYYSSVVGKNEKALAEFERAFDLRQSVTDRERLWIEANYFSIQERYEDAAQSLGVLVDLYPDDAQAHRELAEAYYDVGRVDKSIAELKEVLRLDGRSATAFSALVGYLARSNANEEAIRTFDQARQAGIDAPELHRSVGLAYLGLDKVAEARQEFGIVARGGPPSDDLGEFYLATTDIYEGKLSSAREHLQSVIRRDQSAKTKGLQLVSRYLLGRIGLLAGEPSLAQREAAQIMAASDADLQVIDLRSAGMLYARAGATASARSVLARLERSGQNTSTTWNKSSTLTLQGEIALAEGEPEQAFTAFSSAESTYPQAPARVGLALASNARKEWSGAAENWRQVLGVRGEILREEFAADLALARLELGRLHHRTGDDVASRAEYDECLRLWQHADDFPAHRQAISERQALTGKSGGPK